MFDMKKLIFIFNVVAWVVGVGMSEEHLPKIVPLLSAYMLKAHFDTKFLLEVECCPKTNCLSL